MKKLLLLNNLRVLNNLVILSFIFSGVVQSQTTDNIAQLSACSEAKITEIKAAANSSSPTVKINCNLQLTSTDKITKRLILEGASATGVTIDCNGATLDGGSGTYNYNKDYMIEIRSRKYWDAGVKAWKWERPQNITVKGCKVVGAIRVWGMARNGEGNTPTGSEPNHLLQSSRIIGHTTRARNNAPTNVHFENMTITGYNTTPLYFAPGVTYCSLINSEIKGQAASVAIYLDAESYSNIIKNNYIHVATGSEREQIAIDGSSYNKVFDNRFSALNHGGIYLYRNCGQDSVIRHEPPAHNQIINNFFYYDVYLGSNPSVFLGSRNGNKPYCNEDSGYLFGSSISDLDYARYNAVIQNQIAKRDYHEMIKVNNSQINQPNTIEYNETVTTQINRYAGCYVANGYKTDFILHGQSISLFKTSKGEPYCDGYKYTCNDGFLTRTSDPTCQISLIDFDCQVTGNNNGCQKTVYCPSGQQIIGAKAAANLEYGSVTDAQLSAVTTNTIKVVRTSDNVWQGNAFIGNNALSSGQKVLAGINGLTKVSVGCKEYDTNGGDCDIKGILFCHSGSTIIPIARQNPIIPIIEKNMKITR